MTIGTLTLWHMYLLLIGPAVGSFLGVVAARWPVGAEFLRGRSHCSTCGTTLGAIDMIPLLSAPLLKYRCRHCGAGFGREPLFWEIGGLLCAVLALAAPTPLEVVLTASLAWVLMLLAVLDARHFWLPDPLTLGLVIAGLAYTAYSKPALLAAHILGSAAAYLALWTLNWLYRHMRGRDGLGLGDAKLLAALAAWMGPVAVAPGLLLASLLALFAVAVARLAGQHIAQDTAVPFGVFLALAFIGLWVLMLCLGPLDRVIYGYVI